MAFRYTLIQTNRQLEQFAERLAEQPAIGFDTEFVGEQRYEPLLCLIQVATENELAVIDTLAIDRLSPFWEVIVDGDHETVLHAAREELRFCHRATRKLPKRLFDVQIAAALVGGDYPAAYSSLAQRFVKVKVAKHERRTQWQKRPLTSSQLQYAVEDVAHLLPIYRAIDARLTKLQRRPWLDEENERFIPQWLGTNDQPRWQRLSGLYSMSARHQAIARELWLWRDQVASERNLPAKQILRDDLLIELARRGSAETEKIKSLRGMDHRHVGKHLNDIAEVIRDALQLPEEEWPDANYAARGPSLTAVGQFLYGALGIICSTAQIATSLVANMQDVRDYVAWRLAQDPHHKGDADQPLEKEPPLLGLGWRREIIGNQLDQLLYGKQALRIVDPLADQPLDIITPAAVSHAAEK